MMCLSNIFFVIFAYQYKAIGLAVDIPDSFLSKAASMSALVQTITRVCIGSLYDRYGFKTLFQFLMVVNFVNSIICFPARYNKWLYFVCVQLNFFVIAGVYSLFPVPVCMTFGPKYGA